MPWLYLTGTKHKGVNLQGSPGSSQISQWLQLTPLSLQIFTRRSHFFSLLSIYITYFISGLQSYSTKWYRILGVWEPLNIGPLISVCFLTQNLWCQSCILVQTVYRLLSFGWRFYSHLSKRYQRLCPDLGLYL